MDRQTQNDLLHHLDRIRSDIEMNLLADPAIRQVVLWYDHVQDLIAHLAFLQDSVDGAPNTFGP